MKECVSQDNLKARLAGRRITLSEERMFSGLT